MEEAKKGFKNFVKWTFVILLAFFAVLLFLFLSNVGTITGKEVITFGIITAIFGIINYWDFLFEGEASLTNKLGAILEFILAFIAGFTGLTAIVRFVWIKDFGTVLIPAGFNLWPVFIVSLILAFVITSFRSAYFGSEDADDDE